MCLNALLNVSKRHCLLTLSFTYLSICEFQQIKSIAVFPPELPRDDICNQKSWNYRL